MSSPAILFDHTLLAKRKARAAPHLARFDFLRQRAAHDLADRLQAINRRFQLGVEIGAPAGLLRASLGPALSQKVETFKELDLFAAPTHAKGDLAGGADHLGLQIQSLDFALSAFCLHWANDPLGHVAQAKIALKPDGLFLAVSFAGETLKELRFALIAAEAECRGGVQARIAPFGDLIDLAGLLQRAGFALPVADCDRLTVRYCSLRALLHDLRGMGETFAQGPGVRQRPLTRQILARTEEIYRAKFGLPDGRLPATFELAYLTGWAPHASQQKPLRPGAAKMRLADALGVEEIPAGEKAGK